MFKDQCAYIIYKQPRVWEDTWHTGTCRFLETVPVNYASECESFGEVLTSELCCPHYWGSCESCINWEMQNLGPLSSSQREMQQPSPFSRPSKCKHILVGVPGGWAGNLDLSGFLWNHLLQTAQNRSPCYIFLQHHVLFLPCYLILIVILCYFVIIYLICFPNYTLNSRGQGLRLF